MKKHTPGPWKIHSATERTGPPVEIDIRDANGESVVYGLNQHSPNARLIAAAPDLLLALESARLTLLKVGFVGGDEHVMEYIEAAIDKAEGLKK